MACKTVIADSDEDEDALSSMQSDNEEHKAPQMEQAVMVQPAIMNSGDAAQDGGNGNAASSSELRLGTGTTGEFPCRREKDEKLIRRKTRASSRRSTINTWLAPILLSLHVCHHLLSQAQLFRHQEQWDMNRVSSRRRE